MDTPSALAAVAGSTTGLGYITDLATGVAIGLAVVAAYLVVLRRRKGDADADADARARTQTGTETGAGTRTGTGTESEDEAGLGET